LVGLKQRPSLKLVKQKGNSLMKQKISGLRQTEPWWILGLEQCHQLLSTFLFCCVGYMSDSFSPAFPGRKKKRKEKERNSLPLNFQQVLRFTLIGPT
jgi:hypothetical protein